MIAELTDTIFLKAIRMNARRSYLLVLLLLIGCQQTNVSADKLALPVDEAVAEAELDTQLKINRDALLKGSSEQIRIDAAAVMLVSEEPLARKILLDALKQSENIAARIAVCKALSQAGASQEAINQKGDFIQPMLNILTTDEDFTRAKLAAEATLIFEYEQISEQLEKIVTDPSQPTRARLNAICALKLQPDMRAIFKLMDLLGDPESQVAAEAEKALKSLAIPIGENAKARREIREGLERKGKEEFLMYWRIRQEMQRQMSELKTQLDLWQKMYLAILDKIYEGIGAAPDKGRFLAEHLCSSEAPVRLWALEKVEQLRVGTSKLPAELGPILVNLISDQDRDVRLKTAKLLSLMGELNSAEKLAEQLEIEQYDDVRMRLFVALGVACSYAFLPDSGIEIPPEIRRQTLKWAAEYLSEQEAEKAENGAKVIKKLLEQDGLTSAEVDRYLGLLVERYKRQAGGADGALRGELLGIMAGLCAQTSVHRTKAAKFFESSFVEALDDKTDLVRIAAVDGLINIGKAMARKTFPKDLVNDGSIEVRKRLINLAGEVGGKDDLIWLWEKIGSDNESESAWQAMLKIFKRSDTAVLSKWVAEFDPRSAQSRLSDEQRITFLEMAEGKASGENKPKMLKDVRERLAQIYSKSGEFQQAAEYWGMLRGAAQSTEEKEAILARLLDVYLKWANVEAAAQLVHNCLLERDLEPNSVIGLSIDHYLTSPSAAAEPNAMLEALAKIEIKTTEPRPKWAEQLNRWNERFGRAKEPDKPKEADN